MVWVTPLWSAICLCLFEELYCGTCYMNCPTGGFPTIRHNELHDLTASLLLEVCCSVSFEPHLQPLTILERFFHLLHLTLKMVQDWMFLQMVFGEVAIRKVFIDVKVFNPNALSYRGFGLSSLYRRLEKEKQRKYEECIRDVEMGCFTPLVFSTFWGMSNICNTFFQKANLTTC